MNIAISVESTHDLDKATLKEFDICVIPFQITLGDEEFYDGEKSFQDVFDLVKKKGVLPKTTAVNEYRYTEYFSNLKEDYDAIIHICLSSKITSTINNALAAAKKFKDVYIVDSLSLTSGIGLLAIYARELANQGLSAEEIVAKLEERKSKVQVSFVIERLDYLYKGGRCSGVQLLGANLLKIRPMAVIKEGQMIVDKKYRGDIDMIIPKYCREILAAKPADLDKVFITHTFSNPDRLKEGIKVLQDYGFKRIFVQTAGATVACHCGENTFGILYFEE